jgi:hypothetical protein
MFQLSRVLKAPLQKCAGLWKHNVVNYPASYNGVIRSMATFDTSKFACAVGSPVETRPDNGPTEKINLVTAINQALHCAMEKDPTYVNFFFVC